MTARNHPARTRAEDTEHAMTTGTISHIIEEDETPTWRTRLADAVGARLHAVHTPTGRTITNVIKTARPRRQRQPGAGLVSAGMVLLGLLDAGLLYVVFDAQDRFIFSVKHQHPAAMIQALALDLAMIIFSVLGLGLARRGLAANSERACIVVCAVASAFMNWTASNQASLRSVAVYVSAPILLALTTDRTISVVRRHVLGMREDGSVWARLGKILGHVILYALRLVVDFTGTRSGIRQAILRAAPLPEDLERAAEREDLDVTAVLREELATGLDRIRSAAEADMAGLAGRVDMAMKATDAVMAALDGMTGRLGRLELAAGASAYPTRKAHVLALYRARTDYGQRDAAGAAAKALAEEANVPASTARAYVYEELAAVTNRERGLKGGTVTETLITLPESGEGQ